MPQTTQLSRWGRLYVAVIVGLGAAAIGQSVYDLCSHPIGWNWFILAGLTLLAGSATVKLPSVPATISISETFVITSVLLFGTAAGTITVTLDALTISLWLARRGHPAYRIAFNVCALPAALWISANLFYRLAPTGPLALHAGTVQVTSLVWPLTVFTVLYFLLNSWLIAGAIYFEKGLSPGQVWKHNFALLSLNYFGGASVAALLVTYTRNLDYTFIALVVPLLAVLYFTFSMAMGRVEDTNKHLSELNSLYMSTIETLAMAIDAKDQITHGHIRRVQTYAVGLARTLGVTDAGHISAIEAASLLHDMGKLAVPEYILNKPGPLTPAEFEKMKLHASVGADILSAINFPYPVVPIVRHHHENWDGTGYPDGLAGTNIPIGARILSVVDCYDALTSDRPYRPRLPSDEAIRILLQRRGTMYDPLIVDAFIKVQGDSDSAHDPAHPGSTISSLVAVTHSTTEPAVTAIHARTLENISATSEEALTLFELARTISSHMAITDAADIVATHVRRLIPSSLIVLFLHDVVTDELVATHASGEQAALVRGLRIQMGQRLSGWVATNRHTIRNSDPVLDLGDSARTMTPRPRSCLSTPLWTDERLVGVISMYSSNREAFTQDHERVIELVARQISPVLGNVLDRDKRQPDSNRMGLLPTPSRERLGSMSTRPESGDAPASLVAFRLDNLASIIQRHGRAMGDAVITKVTSLANLALREHDVLFRNDEAGFMVLLPDTSRVAANAIAARLREAIASVSADVESQITTSLVIVSKPEDGISVSAILKVAQDRLRNADNVESSGANNRIH